MWFLWQLLQQANVLFTTNESSNQYSASVGEIALQLLIQSSSLQAFWAIGKTYKSKAQCSAGLSLDATLGSQPAHQTQTVGQTELFIQLYTLFGGCMSLTDWETICCVSLWITNFELCFSEAVGNTSSVFTGLWFLAEIKALWQLSHSWTPSWPSKCKMYLKSNNIRCEHKYCPFPPPFSPTVCGKGSIANIAPLNIYFLKDRYYWNTSGNSWVLHLHWLGFELWNWGLRTTTMLI